MKLSHKIGGLTVGVATVAFIIGWEGNKTRPYIDLAGVPTACAGVTRNIDMKRIYSPEECAVLNLSEMQRHADDLSKCVKVPLSDGEATAYISWAYNVGAGNACNSTLIRMLNEGKRLEACDQLLRWNKVQGKEVRGLTNRRNAERALCVEGASGRT